MTVRHHPEQRLPFGFNVIGYVTGNLGMGVSTRNTLSVLTERGFPLVAMNFDAFSGHVGPDRTRPGLDTTYSHLEPDRPSLPYGINLYHINPPGIRSILLDRLSWHRASRGINVCVPFWELEQLPGEWVAVLDAMDVVLAPTLFIRDAVLGALPGCRCLHYPQAVDLPEDISRDRARWGFADDEIVFVASFDVSSGFGRKNPWAAVDAFTEAFERRSDVRLVVKTNPFARRGVEELEQLRRRAAADRRITLIEESLDYTSVLALYAASDVLVSLHRSEGLGLNMMEAMALGKPVIATAWSGNMDFTTEENSALVGFRWCGLDPNEPNYPASEVGPDARWADPSVEEAAGWMRRLADDPALRGRLGERAQADMALRLQVYRAGAVFDQLRELYEGDEALWADHDAKLEALRALGKISAYRFLRRRVGLALRGVGLWK